MNFHKLNMDTWERADIFRHFIDDMRCVMSMTADIDVTNLVKTVHERSLHFYPTMIWAVSAAVNCRQELRMGFDKDGNPGIWDFVSPYYAHFYPEDQRFVKLVTAYHPDFDTFYRQLMLDRERCRTLRGFELRDLPPNTFDLSCLPWIHYRSFDMHVEGTVVNPGQTGKVEGVGRKIPKLKSAQRSAALPVQHQLPVKGVKIRMIGSHQLDKALVLRVEVGVVRGDKVPDAGVSVLVKAHAQLLTAVDCRTDRPDHGWIKVQRPFVDGFDQVGDVDVCCHAHHAAHVVDEVPEDVRALPCVHIQFVKVHFTKPPKILFYFRRLHPVRSSSATILSCGSP